MNLGTLGPTEVPTPESAAPDVVTLISPNVARIVRSGEAAASPCVLVVALRR